MVVDTTPVPDRLGVLKQLVPNMKIKIDPAFVGVMPWLKSFGYTEDGTEVIADTLRVCVENEIGDRWVLYRGIDTVKVERDEDGFPYHINVKDEAEARVNVLVEKVKAAGEIEDGYWEYYPVYGSDAYLIHQNEERLNYLNQGE